MFDDTESIYTERVCSNEKDSDEVDLEANAGGNLNLENEVIASDDLDGAPPKTWIDGEVNGLEDGGSPDQVGAYLPANPYSPTFGLVWASQHPEHMDPASPDLGSRVPLDLRAL